MKLKNKIQNYLMIDGRKPISEKCILKSFKVLQKAETKNHKDLFKFIIINNISIIQIKQIKKKKRKTIKEFPFILNQKNRITVSIKSILKKINQKKLSSTVIKISSELINVIKNKTELLIINEKDQEYALTKKKYIYFRWFY